HGLLCDEKAAERGDGEGTLDVFGAQVDERAARAPARVEDDDIERRKLRIDFVEKERHLLRIGHVAIEGERTRLAAQRRELRRIARRQGDAHSLFREEPGYGSTQSLAGADDERALVLIGHRDI